MQFDGEWANSLEIGVKNTPLPLLINFLVWINGVAVFELLADKQPDKHPLILVHIVLFGLKEGNEVAGFFVFSQ